MKKLLLLLGLVAGTASFVQAQNVNIPDANFKNALLTQSFVIDTNGDGEISFAEAAVVTYLNLDEKNISNMTGIEAFVNLGIMDCNGNLFTSIDLSQNTELSILHMSSLYLTSLDIRYNVKLTSLILEGLPLTTIDFSQNPLLMNLNISNSQLYGLDLSNNPNMYLLFCSSTPLVILNLKNGNNGNLNDIVAHDNPNLRCIEVDDPAWSTANWTGPDFVFDSWAGFVLDCSNLTYIPDENFEAYLEANGMGDGIPNNHHVLTSNINNEIFLDIQGLGIQDLTGIEDFAALQYLDCSNNSISTIDLSQNLNFTELFCSNNLITFINVNYNAQLYSLDCSHNLLTSLNVMNNPNLTFLSFSYNALTDINLTQHTYPLVVLEADHNRLEGTLDISNCPNLQVFDASNQDPNCPTCFTSAELISVNLQNGNNASFTHINLSEIPTLRCVQVDNALWAEANWTGANFIFGSEVLFSENCDSILSTVNVDKNEITMYPNPVKDMLYFSEEVSQIKITDISGKLVKQITSKSKSINVSQLSKGVYLVNAISKTGEKISKKLIVN